MRAISKISIQYFAPFLVFKTTWRISCKCTTPYKVRISESIFFYYWHNSVISMDLCFTIDKGVNIKKLSTISPYCVNSKNTAIDLHTMSTCLLHLVRSAISKDIFLLLAQQCYTDNFFFLLTKMSILKSAFSYIALLCQ